MLMNKQLELKSIRSLVRMRRGVRDLTAAYEIMLQAMVPARPAPRPWVRPQVRVEPGPLRDKQQAYQALRCQIYELLVRECEITLFIHVAIARKSGLVPARHHGVARASASLEHSKLALEAYRTLTHTCTAQLNNTTNGAEVKQASKQAFDCLQNTSSINDGGCSV